MAPRPTTTASYMIGSVMCPRFVPTAARRSMPESFLGDIIRFLVASREVVGKIPRTPMKWIWSLIIISASLPLFAQSGDKQDEVQAPPPASLKIPPAPPLSVEEALKSFKLQPGFRIEVVAT